MAGGNSITLRVSAALRKAQLGVAMYGSTSWAPTRCMSVRTDECYVANHLTGANAQGHADDIEAVLIARGFLYERTIHGDFNVFASTESEGYKFYLRVRAAKRELQSLPPEPQAVPLTSADSEQAAIEASSLDVAKLMQNTWAVRHDGARNAYQIVRTGKNERARYAVQARDGRIVEKNLRTLAEALTAVQTDIDSAL